MLLRRLRRTIKNILDFPIFTSYNLSMKDVMLDFETLGNGKDKCLRQVGAVYFDNITGELGQELKLTIDAATHEKIGGKLDASTVYWWLSQSDEARASILDPNKVDILVALSELNIFLSSATRIWSHATFDFVTLMDCLKQAAIKPSFSYKAGMDLRTLVYLAGTSVSDFLREGVHHDGLADAKHQVKYCVAAFNAVKTNSKVIKLLSTINT